MSNGRIIAGAGGLSLALLVAGCPKQVGGEQGGGANVAVSFKQEPDPSAGAVVATIGDSAITIADLQARLDKQSPFVRARYQSPEKKKEFLDNQVRFELLAQEALRRGLDKDPDVQETIKKVMVQKLTRTDFEGKVTLSDITEEDMRQYYKEHDEEYNKPEMVRASLVKVDFGEDKEAARKKAEAAHKSATEVGKLEDRAHFRRLVGQFSTDVETQKTGGDLRYLGKKELEERFGAEAAEAVWGLKGINEVTGVIEGEDAFYVFKKTGKRKPITRSFEQVKNQIRNLLYREKRTEAFNDFVEKLKKDFQVKTFQGELDKLEVKGGPEGSGDGTLLPPRGAHPEH